MASILRSRGVFWSSASPVKAAKAVGIEDMVGSIAVGKDADIVIYSSDDDPFSPYVSPEKVMIRGNWI